MIVDESPAKYMGGKKNGYDVFSSRTVFGKSLHRMNAEM